MQELGNKRVASCRQAGGWVRGVRQVFVLFDLDGTLVDSGPAHRRAAESAFRQKGIAAVEESLMRFLVAHDAASAGMRPDLYFEIWRRMQPLYRVEQESILAFPGIGDALVQLLSLGIGAGVVTSKRRWAVERELERLGWRDLFACVVCREDTRRHKPSPEPILRAMDQIGQGALAYVGDAPSDVLAAKAAGLAAVGAAWGWTGGAALQAAGADWVLDAPSGLLPWLQGLGGPDLRQVEA